MKYFFILGIHPAISLSELTSVLPDGVLKLDQTKKIALAELSILNPQELILRLGGTIKIGQIIKEVKKNKLIEEIKDEIITQDKKYLFGISDYTKTKIQTKAIGMKIKKYLKKRNQNCRLVISKEKTLSSVVVEQNKLVREGDEFCLIGDNKKLLLGKTLAVQPFKSLSFRDYGRPARDDLSGMLPPKLAQILINFAQVKKTKFILDPFTGSGTILMEAILMGYTNIIGSDISSQAITNTKTNLNWLAKKYQLDISKIKLTQIDAIKLNKKIMPPINAIITEPYLGPPRGQISPSKTLAELNSLYSQALESFTKILLPGGRIVMIWPVFKINDKLFWLNPELKNLSIKNIIPEKVIRELQPQKSPRKTLVYSRTKQKVLREIVILEN